MNLPVTIIGPTASGKTALAIELAKKYNGEIISIDSRQFYKKLDIGTGKDLHLYGDIKYHLINIAEPGEQLNVSNFKKHFQDAYQKIQSNKKTTILCGGTGNYLLSILKPSPYTEIPVNDDFRKKIEGCTHDHLLKEISKKTIPKNFSIDTSTHKRCVRILEILFYLENNSMPTPITQTFKTIIFGINPSIELRRQRIDQRLHERLEHGLIEEVEALRKILTDDDIIYYGLEYKFVTEFLKYNWTREELEQKLSVAIHQFAKRQMTFFRKIDKDGFKIHWLPDGKELQLTEISKVIHNTNY